MKMNRREIIKTAVLAAVAPRVLAEPANDAQPPAVSAATEAVLSGLCVLDRRYGVESSGNVSKAVMRVCLLGADGHRPTLQFHAADLADEATLHKFVALGGKIQYGVDEHGERMVRCGFKGWTLAFDGDSNANGDLHYIEKAVPFNCKCPTEAQWGSLHFVASLKAISNATETKQKSGGIAGVFWMSRGKLKGLPPAHPEGYRSFHFKDNNGADHEQYFTDRIQLMREAGEKLTLNGWHDKNHVDLVASADFQWLFSPKNGRPLRLAIYSSPPKFKHHDPKPRLQHFDSYYEVLGASPHKLNKQPVFAGKPCDKCGLSFPLTLSSGYCPPGKYP